TVDPLAFAGAFTRGPSASAPDSVTSTVWSQEAPLLDMNVRCCCTCPPASGAPCTDWSQNRSRSTDVVPWGAPDWQSAAWKPATVSSLASVGTAAKPNEETPRKKVVSVSSGNGFQPTIRCPVPV